MTKERFSLRKFPTEFKITIQKNKNFTEQDNSNK